MPALNYAYLVEIEQYLSSGNLAQDFYYSPEDRRHEILAFLEKLMDMGELADATATKIIFRQGETSDSTS